MTCFCCNKRPATVVVNVGQLSAKFCDECAKPILVKTSAALCGANPQNALTVERLQ
jgi:hypothetical protein